MSADRETVLHHLIQLNPPVWVIGDEGSEPVGRLLTLEVKIYQGDPHGQESRLSERIWKSADLTEIEADSLEAQHHCVEKSRERERLSELMNEFGK